MFSISLLAAFAVLTPVVYFCTCFIVYFYDRKGFRRFHNLSAISGATDIPWLWESIHGRRYKTLHAAHQKSSIVRIAPNIISFNDPSAAASIYGHGTKATKSPFYDASGAHFKNVADTRDKQDHARKRRLLATGYALTTLLRWEGKVASRVNALLDQYDARCVSPDVSNRADAVPVDHRRWMDLFTIDTINDIGLSANLRMIEKGDDSIEVQNSRGQTYRCNFRKSLWGGLRIHASFAWAPKWYSSLKRLTWWDSRWQDSAAFDDIVTTQTKHRIHRHLAGEKLDDFFSYLLENKDGAPNMLTLGEMVAECSVMLNAGSETTGISLSNLLYLLIVNPKALERLRQEVDEALSGLEDVKVAPFDSIRYLPYLKACIDEGLRLHPPSVTTTPRITAPSGQEIMGQWIPGNTEVLCPTYTLQRNPTVFSNPESFQPERWLGENAKVLQSAFLPFSLGPRGCIGRNITYMEQQMLIASLVHRYTFDLISPDFKPTYEEAVTCSPGPIPIYLARRARP
ncbi:cytochrome P450 monooxygenase [Lophium mytilinum]|uniref:Cytochrome P450 monooxygenase n=1 Tax=Lophium mytilinum TaxID=390894 RepID=A0A6A6QT73_9PEZI|nr:cytochrome P450 monooxygenase [Lophium mytilinum]